MKMEEQFDFDDEIEKVKWAKLSANAAAEVDEQSRMVCGEWLDATKITPRRYQRVFIVTEYDDVCAGFYYFDVICHRWVVWEWNTSNKYEWNEVVYWMPMPYYKTMIEREEERNKA